MRCCGSLGDAAMTLGVGLFTEIPHNTRASPASKLSASRYASSAGTKGI